MSTPRHFDAIVVGAGQSGPSLALDLAEAGQSVAIIERHLFGGTCVNTGCIPTKALIASARVAHVTRTASNFGVWTEGGVRVDMKQIKHRKDKISEASRRAVEESLRSAVNCTVFDGHARFVSDSKLEIDGRHITAERIFLNVGARAAIPDIPGLDIVPYLTNSSMMNLAELPSHLVIMGGSYIALEFAQMYRRFGSDVTILQRGPRILGREDADIADALTQILEAEGIVIHCNVTDIAVSPATAGIAIQTNSPDTSLIASHLLLATGRRPNTDTLGIENTSIQLDRHGFIQVDDQLRSTAAGVWAIGDCNGKGAFTHTSYNDYEIVAANLLKNGSRRVTDRIPAYAIYTDPPLGRAGMTEAEVRASGRKALIATRPMTRVGRAYERSETQGFLKVLVDADSKLILGAAILGIEGDEAIHSLLDTMYAKVPYTVLQQAVHIHPTVSELIPTLLGSLEPLDTNR